MDEQVQRSKESTKLDHGILLENPTALISEVKGSSVGGNPKRMRDPTDEGTSRSSSNSDNAGEILNIQIDEIRQKTTQAEEGLPAVGSANEPVLETVIVVNSEENQPNQNWFESSKEKADKSTKNVSEGKKKSCVIDVRCGNGGFKDSEGEKVCRICHLSSEGLAEPKATGFSAELMQLGCGCKDELGIAHGYCAEAWFKLKGNRVCEICGEMARNITGVGDNRFMEEWNQRRFVGTSISIPSDGSNGCWRGQPFCNFLMACLVVAFVLPWFFRVNMF